MYHLVLCLNDLLNQNNGNGGVATGWFYGKSRGFSFWWFFSSTLLADKMKMKMKGRIASWVLLGSCMYLLLTANTPYGGPRLLIS